MKLLKLRANKESFHTITFNKQGISLIVAKNRTEKEKSTYNSVGKSLSIALVHFCLASNELSAFKELLNDWVFYLDFELNNQFYTSERSAFNQDTILLNGRKMSLTDFRNFMGKEVFILNKPIKCLTFRSLIHRFIRPKRSSYDSYDKYVDRETDYTQLLNNSYLLGLDICCIVKKKNLKEELDTVTSSRKAILKDPFMKSFFMEKNVNIEIKIVELEKKITELQKNIDEFVIAEDYNEIKKEADRISTSLKTYRNQAEKFRMAIYSIEKSLQFKPDITHLQIMDLYQEAKIQLNDMVVKRLEDIELFNARILDNRSINLLLEKQQFEKCLLETEAKIESLGQQENEKLQYLNSHGALDEYTQLSHLLAANKTSLDKLNQYKLLVKEYKTKQEEVKKEFANENIATTKYLEDIELLTKKNILIYQSLTDQFYEDKSSGITIDNNDGKNKLRFNIQARISDDTGDGVNEVRTFCFDWTLLKGQYNHNVKFIFHDSRLVSENDPRQVATMLRIAQKECRNNNFQYILSVNQSTLDLLKKELTEDEYKMLITDNEVLELNDLSDANKLLGIQVDLNYVKE